MHPELLPMASSASETVVAGASWLARMTDANNPFAPLNWYNNIGTLGCVFWLFAYLLIIRDGFRHKTYGVPLLAICLNITWEGLAFFGHSPVMIWKVLEGLWLIFDVIILYQLLRYGRNQLLVKALKPWFYLTVAGCLLLSFLFQWSWRDFWDDKLLFIDAFIINLVMSGLYILLALGRPDLKGLSIPVGWLKMLGTACTCACCAIFLPKVMEQAPWRENWNFAYVLFISIFVLDALYVAMLYERRAELHQKAVSGP